MPRYSWKGEDLGEIGEFDFSELEAIKKITKMLPREFSENSENGDPLCTRAVIYLLLRRNGRMVRFEDVKGKPSELVVHFSDEEKAEQAADEAEIIDPLTRRILERLGVSCDDEFVKEVVLEELVRAKDEQDDELGKAPSVAAPNPTSTQTTSSGNTPPDSGTSSASTITTSNEHRGELSSITHAQ